MINFEEIKEKLNKVDRFCAFNSMRLTSVGESCAEAEYDVSEDSLNGHDVVQGGAIYTLCDFAFAGASWSTGRPCIGLNSSISYLRPGKGPKITATATLVHNGRTTCVCEAVARNPDGKIIARCTLTGYFLDQKK